MKRKLKLNSQNIWNIENNFYLRSDVSRLNKIIFQYEIFKKTLNVPGSIIECGVFRGVSLIRLLTFRNLYKNNLKKKVIGFDAFGSFPKQKIKEDNKFAISHDNETGVGIDKKILQSFLNKKKFNNFNLLKGNIEKTIPDFLKKNKILKISFLHLDLDVYEPTKFALEAFYDKISKNGIILIDDYSQVNGATRATNDFLKKNKKIKIEKLNFNSRLFFIVKK
jgi:hypothetical protein